MNKKNIIVISFLIILICIFIIGLLIKNRQQKEIINNEFDIKTNIDTIYKLFNNFPESNNIYYTSYNLYSKRSIEPEIYQIDILAELTDTAYDKFINQVEFKNLENFKMKINPHNITYDWKSIKNIQVIESKDIEVASITNIYLDTNTKTIYIIAVGGN